MPSLLFPPPHVDADRRAIRPNDSRRRLTRNRCTRSEIGGDVGEEHERRRRDAGLRRVEDADFAGAGAAGGWTAVTAATKRFSSEVGIRRVRALATLSMVSRTLGVRSPVAAEICRTWAYCRNSTPRRSFSSNSLEKSVPRRFIRSHLFAAMMMPATGLVGFAPSRHPDRSRPRTSRRRARRRRPFRWPAWLRSPTRIRAGPSATRGPAAGCRRYRRSGRGACATSRRHPRYLW